jgi:subtilase family serine protease
MLGAGFSVTDTVFNQGTGSAGASTVRYYLSTDTVKGGDTRLTGTRSVGALAAQGSSAGTVTVTVPLAVTPGIYYVLACADDLNAVTETSESNNCRASVTTVQVTAALADLTVTAVSNPPASVPQGGSFPVTDTVKNQGVGTAGVSTVRYYLSTDTLKGGDTLLAGARSVGTLVAQGISTGTVTVTVPSGMALGTYRVLACADDLKTVAESSEANNCSASATPVQVTGPDLTVTAVSDPPSSVAQGGSFEVTDTVENQAAAAAGPSTVQYYLSTDPLTGGGEILLTGARTVGTLPAQGNSTGTVTVTVPSDMALGTYYVLACADDLNAVVENSETNNCLASGTTVKIRRGQGQP